MTIRNMESYISSVADWGFLNECFKGTKISMGDVDGIVERNGYLLLVEAKPAGSSVTVGQNIMHLKSARGHDRTTFMVIYGQTPDTNNSIPDGIEKVVVHHNGQLVGGDGGQNLVRYVVDWWFKCANKRKFHWPP